MNNYFLIDITKVILAVCVVLLHTPPIFESELINTCLYSICDVAVPLFFAFSGFFFNKTGCNTKKTVLRLTTLYLLWTLISIYMVMGQLFNQGLTLPQILKSLLFSHSFNVSWYLVALIWCVLISKFTEKWHPVFRFVLAIGLYTMCIADLSFQSYLTNSFICQINDIYKWIFGTVCWSFPQGLIFFFIGYYAESFISEKSKVNKQNILVLFFSLILWITEIIYFKNSDIISGAPGMLSMPLLVFSIIVIVLKSCVPMPFIIEGKILRNISTLLYLSHPMIKAVWIKIYGYDGPLGLLFLAISFSLMFFIIFKLQKYTNFRWLKYTY